MLTIRRIGVVGAGTMGNGIAQVFAQAGFEVRLVDAAPGALDRARATIEKSLAKLVEKGRLSASDRNASLDRLSTGMNLDALTDVDYVVEAIFEMEQAKRELFARLDQLTRPEVILSSNTSSISITTLGAATNRADKVLGIACELPPLEVDSDDGAEVLVLGWGSSLGAIRAAVRRVRLNGHAVATAHLRHLHPLPTNLGEVLHRYERVLVPEMNTGQLAQLLRSGLSWLGHGRRRSEQRGERDQEKQQSTHIGSSAGARTD